MTGAGASRTAEAQQDSTLLARLEEVPRAAYPFTADIPRPEAAGSTWLEPQVVIDVAALGVTADGRLRQPSFQGVRPDLTPEDLLEEP